MRKQDSLNPVLEAEEIDYCLKLYKEGHSYRTIEKMFEADRGYRLSHRTIGVRIKKGIDMIVIPAVDDYRKVELERLNYLDQKNAEKLEAGDAGAITVALRISERRSKLLGMDAPQQVQAVVATVDVTETPFGELMKQRLTEQKALEAQLAAEDDEEEWTVVEND